MEKDGSISDAKALNDPGFGFAKAAVDAIKFTVEKQPAETLEPMINAKVEANQGYSDMQCSLDNPDACEACGS